MSSLSVTQDKTEDEQPLLNEDDDTTTMEKEIINEIDVFLKFNKLNQPPENSTKNTTENSTKNTTEIKKNVTKGKKRKAEENNCLDILTEVFLRIFYPISLCMNKCVSIGLMKSLDYSPTVLLTHGTKTVLFNENAWESFLKHLHLIECYLSTNLYGRKTNIRLLDCDNEIDIVKHRGDVQVRFRDLTQHDSKILLTREEFFILKYTTSSVTRYMKQLVFSSSVIKEYLVDTLEKQPESTILYGHVDTSIFNRLPHEVEMWRQLRSLKTIDIEIATEAKEEEEIIYKPDEKDNQNEAQVV